MQTSRVGAFLAVAVIGCCLGVGFAPAATADDQQNPYSADASASAVRLSIHDPEIVPFLTGGGFDVTAPLAQASADNLGGGRSVASMVYPGDDIAGISAVVGMFAPAGVPMPQLPAYPVTVSAQPGNTNPPAQTSPAYDLRASIGDGTASAAATGGVPAASLENFKSTADAKPTDKGGVTATGTTTAGLVSLGGLLKIGTITSTATASRDSTGKLTRSSSLDIDGATIAGLELGIKDGQLEVPVLGTYLPLDKFLGSNNPLLKGLDLNGFKLSITPEQDTPNGVIAPSIELSYQVKTAALNLPAVDLPNLIPAQPAIGPIPPSTFTMSVTIGAAQADATLTPLPSFNVPFPPNVNVSDPGLPSSAPPPAVTAPSSAPAPVVPDTSTGGDVPAGVPVDTGDADAPVDTGDSSVPVAAGDAGSAPPVSQPQQTQPQQTQPQIAARPASYRVQPTSFRSGTFYLVFIVIGAAALGAAQLVRFRGVKTSWTS